MAERKRRPRPEAIALDRMILFWLSELGQRQKGRRISGVGFIRNDGLLRKVRPSAGASSEVPPLQATVLRLVPKRTQMQGQAGCPTGMARQQARSGVANNGLALEGIEQHRKTLTVDDQ